MSLLAITARKVVTPLETIERGVVLVEDETISAVGRADSIRIPSQARSVDVGDKMLAPGFVDVHIHGGVGHDVMEGTPEALDAIARALIEHGTTSFVPTTLSAPGDLLCKSLAGLHSVFDTWRERNGAARAEPLGIHLEGPFLSRLYRGAHPSEHLQNPSIDILRQFVEAGGGAVRIVTLAPELEGARELQAYAMERGLHIAIGHSGANYEEAMRAIDAGANHGIHVFNAMRPFTHRDPGIVGAVLTDDRVFAEVIADGVHVDPAALRLLVRAKGAARILLITDAVSATGMCPGRYFLGDMEIFVGDDPRSGRPTCRNGEGALAGSILRQEQAVRNMITMARVSLQEALTMASYNPARLLGMENRKGLLCAGADADIAMLDNSGRVAGTMVRGRPTESSRHLW